MLTSSIPYLANQLADLSSWYNNMYPIPIFGTSDFIKINTSNITTSLYKIGFFIRNRNFSSKTEKNISHISSWLSSLEFNFIYL